MTTFDRIEPRLPELIDELAAARIPDYFDDMLLATAAAKQRPAWSSLERWLPMGEIARPLPTPQVPWRLLAVAAALVILAAGLVAYAGSRTRVPPPFGPAVNGSMFYDADGVIYAGDPTTSTAKAIVDGPAPFTYPLPSRDGRRIVYDHTELGTSQLLVADADGSNAHPLAGTFEGWTWTEWSPDGQRIGIVSRGINGRQAISILDVDGSAVQTVPLDREVLTFWWLPDGGFVFTGAESPGDTCHDGGSANRCALFVVGADGKDPQMLLGASAFSGLSTSLSPDGKSVLYVRWADGEPGRLHIVDVPSGQTHPVPFDNLDPQENSNIAEFSPDGSQILFDRYEANQEDHWAVIPSAGGTAVNLGPEWPDSPEGTGPEAHWSPDGKSVTAFYPGMIPAEDQLLLLDPTGKAPDQTLDLPVSYVPAWQRQAP